MGIANVRVELKNDYESADRNFMKMMCIFKRECAYAQIFANFKQHQVFETRSQKKRRKLRESEFDRKCERIRQAILAGKRIPRGHLPFEVAMRIYDDDGRVIGYV